MVVLGVSRLNPNLGPSSSYFYIDEEITQSTAANRQKQLAFLEGALKTATAASGWTVLLAHHPAFSGEESYFSEDEMGTPESTAWAKVSDLVKKYKPAIYLNGHDHVVTHSTVDGYATQFLVSGAGSFSEPSDGGWNVTSNSIKESKPYLKYSNVRMKDGQSFVGNIIFTVTKDQLKAEIFSIDTGLDPQYILTCDKSLRCVNTPGNNPNFVQP